MPLNATGMETSELVHKVKRKPCIDCVCECFFLETDKQLVELIHVKALGVLSAHQQSSLRYQSVTLFLRGRSTLDKFTDCMGFYVAQTHAYSIIA